MNATALSRVLLGMTAHAVAIETHVAPGLPTTTIVGLPEGAVRESRDRVRSALTSSGFNYPEGRIIINLAPGDLAKSGTSLDLPIAISLLAATRQLNTTLLTVCEFLGELSLFGELRKVTGSLTAAQAAQAKGRQLIVPTANAAEASLIDSPGVVTAPTLLSVVQGLQNPDHPIWAPVASPVPVISRAQPGSLDQILGQSGAKRALVIAAAGGHHLLMVGPPGTGKTMLARGFVDLLPDLSPSERLEVAAVYSAAGLQRTNHYAPPLRDPHHSASAQALLGGGRVPVPGEVALAHRGVLFMDELPHFKPSVLDQLREPIESGEAVLSRASYKVRFPCRFQLLAAMNPCPAGRACRDDACRCTAHQVQRYQSRISGPLLDRIDLHVSVPELPHDVLVQQQDRQSGPATDELKEQVAHAQQRQHSRQDGLNGSLKGAALEAHMQAANIDAELLKKAIDKHQLSARSYHKLWRVARTIADLESSAQIAPNHLTEALSYRALDWEAGV